MKKSISLLFILASFTCFGQIKPERTFITPHLINDIGEIVISGTNSAITVAIAGVDPAVYAGITVQSTDLYDWANLQYAMYLEQQTGKPLSTNGTFKVNKMIDLGKYNNRLVWKGNFAAIETIGENTFPVIGRPMPADNRDANVMIAAMYQIENLDIKCASKQIGLEPGPTYGSRYTGINVTNALTAIHLQFNLDAYVGSCFATGCINGFIFDIGNWPDATNTNSQSNGSYCTNSRCYFGKNGEVGFGIYGSGGVTIESCIVEGAKCKRGVDIDGLANTTTKRNYVYNFHWETVQGTGKAGSGEAAVYVRMGGGVVEIVNMKNDYPSIMIDAASQGGWLTVELRNVSYWKAMPDGKIFNNANQSRGGVTWKIRNFEKPAAEIMASFAGNPVKQSCQADNDANRVCIE